MFSSYSTMDQCDDELEIYKDLSFQRQCFLLRKQFDFRMKQLACVGLGQRAKIAKFENFIELQQEKEEQRSKD